MKRVTQFKTSDGRRIFQFPVRAFAALTANVYLVDDGRQRILIDCGSGQPQSNEDLLAGLLEVSQLTGCSLPDDLDVLLLTHGHIDHFGGLPLVKESSSARIGIHWLDRAVVTHHNERATLAAHRLKSFLREAGVPDSERERLLSVYLWGKTFYQPTAIDFELQEGFLSELGVEIFHVPGHCPGQVCLRFDDVLLTADHVLARITPHQAPESIVCNMGLGHYLASLKKISAISPQIRHCLGGHENPFSDLAARCREIQAFHEERLQRILEICSQPVSVRQVSLQLFGPVKSYHVLLALEEAGAHAEYLYQRGQLALTNCDEIQSDDQSPLLFKRT